MFERDIEDVRKEISNEFLEHQQAFVDCFLESERRTKTRIVLNQTIINTIVHSR